MLGVHGVHRLGPTDRTLLWGTAALIVFTLGAITVARSNGGPVVGADDSQLCYNSAGVGAACLPPAPTGFDDAAVPSAPAPSPVVTAPSEVAPPAVPPVVPSVVPSPTLVPPPSSKPPSSSKPPASTTASRSPAAKPVVPAWAAGVAYQVGARVSYQGGVYACRQAHTSQSDWSPPVTPALWSRVS
ncbi:carbohydrate-binding protein [Dactylosporangium sp. NPDC000521]|uniref:carbohydrate-binding protein n=1 Tax=Dactylosporangium sp. NPDC000521 TaxID=3363975 RepID=UPI0036B64E66